MKYLLLCICLASCFICWKITRLSEGQTVIVAIQPLGKVDKQLLNAVAASIKKVYSFQVVILPEKELPPTAFINIKYPRYRADKLISYLWKIKPDSVDYIIGITGQDISTTKRDGLGKIKEPTWKYNDWGIMGLGYCPGKSCVVSTFRLKWKNPTRQLLVDRVQKVAVHEIGHNLWLPHCPVEGCVMNSANETIKTIDKEKLGLCEKCRKKIQ